MQGAPADAELFRRGGDVAFGAGERLHDQAPLGFMQIERARLFAPASTAVIPPGRCRAAPCRTFMGNSRTVIFGPFAMTTPCSIAVRSSRTLPGQS